MLKFTKQTVRRLRGNKNISESKRKKRSRKRNKIKKANEGKESQCRQVKKCSPGLRQAQKQDGRFSKTQQMMTNGGTKSFR